jgi:SAM-dependent methyltransferase
LLTDTDQEYRGELRRRFAAEPAVEVEALTLPDPRAAERFRRYRLDTVVAFNVLEHIEQDVAALRSIADMLAQGGRAVVLVPAFQSLYGTLDVELGHCRRYTRRSLAAAMTGAGLTVERVFYFNFAGALGWWLSARVRRQPRIPERQLRIFDALVPMLRLEDRLPLPLGQSVIGLGSVGGR